MAAQLDGEVRKPSDGRERHRVRVDNVPGSRAEFQSHGGHLRAGCRDVLVVETFCTTEVVQSDHHENVVRQRVEVSRANEAQVAEQERALNRCRDCSHDNIWYDDSVMRIRMATREESETATENKMLVFDRWTFTPRSLTPKITLTE
ncbi:hypothetical protein PC128_g11330 [Phytophthora cactorum]|nr:hypothetical protein PC128_g11330 [Phytophthora cactorum]